MKAQKVSLEKDDIILQLRVNSVISRTTENESCKYENDDTLEGAGK